MQARNHDHDVHIGGDSMVFSSVYGPPFFRHGTERRDGSLADFENFAKLAQTFEVLDSVGGVVVKPNDAPLDSRHLDMVYRALTMTDKIIMGNVVTGTNAEDTVAMGEMVFGGREAIEETPFCISLINCNSPLRWDDRMLDSLFVYTQARQPCIVTQLINPGAPVVFGSFLSNIDMQSGSPQFGTPESGIGLLATDRSHGTSDCRSAAVVDSTRHRCQTLKPATKR
jgi:trimethylamine--corrinoid protein Co-methyltransferase